MYLTYIMSIMYQIIFSTRCLFIQVINSCLLYADSVCCRSLLHSISNNMSSTVTDRDMKKLEEVMIIKCSLFNNIDVWL